jgi:hypothetical protein
MRIGGSPAR